VYVLKGKWMQAEMYADPGQRITRRMPLDMHPGQASCPTLTLFRDAEVSVFSDFDCLCVVMYDSNPEGLFNSVWVRLQ
jgi:hypothetical protein